MKKSTLLLAATLAANLVLAGFVFSRSATPDNSGRATNSRTRGGGAPDAPVAPAAGARAVAASGPGPAAVIPPELHLSQQEWESLAHAGDLKAAAARFRAAGMPENVVSMLVSRLVQERFRDRFAAIFPAGEIPPFWSARAGGSVLNDPERRVAQQEISREMNALMREALGATYRSLPQNPDVLASYRRQYGEISTEKIAQILEMSDRFSELQQDVYNRNMFGPTLPEDREKLAQIEKDRRAAIAAILSPEEMEQYELRSSQSANTVRNQLAAFEPTEEEFKTIYRIQKAFDDQYGTNNLTPEEARERSLRQADLQAQIAAALSPDRAEDYKLASQGSTSMLARLTSRLGLPTRAALDVVAIQQEFQQRANTLRSGARGGPPIQELTQLANEAGARLTSILGEEGVEAYKSYGGSWLQNLVPQPRPAAPAAPIAR